MSQIRNSKTGQKADIYNGKAYRKASCYTYETVRLVKRRVTSHERVNGACETKMASCESCRAAKGLRFVNHLHGQRRNDPRQRLIRLISAFQTVEKGFEDNRRVSDPQKEDIGLWKRWKGCSLDRPEGGEQNRRQTPCKEPHWLLTVL